MENTKNVKPALWGKKILALAKANPIVVLLAIVSIFVGFFVDNFFSWGNLGNLISNTAIRFIIALGVSGCLITKGTDLSAGRQVGLAACLAGVLVQRGDYTGRLWKAVPEMNMWLVFLIVIAVGIVIGLINGLIIAKLKVPPFIATLGTQTIIYGICLVFTDAQPIGGFQKIYIQLITGRIGSATNKGFYLPYLLFVAIFFGVIFWFIYNKTCHGKYMYAIGGNEVAAEVSGVNTSRTIIRIYATAGFMYAVAGYLLAAKSGGSSASMGMGYELEAIAGCTIGGVSTTGGIGTVSGILVGVLVFELLKIVLQFLGVNPYYNYVVQGVVIVVAVALDIRKYIAKK
ncbi:MAG: beta-methylgalactoside transporter [Candidatus Ornithospirochaeta sp.]|nr:beta-methylgalactoside transporter [Sphaerochaetaceae bacterium]MDY5522995.1 beta-methylgalactoside transporter [Candidatus Ornithospirochaeta sp.]